MKILAERLRELRKQKNVSQREVAAAIGVAERNYRRYEIDGTDPAFSKAIALAEFFEVSLDYLAGRD